jgi:hypothetical protein
MKISEIRERLRAIKGRNVWFDIHVSNLSTIEPEITTYTSDTKSSTKHSSIAAALAFLERGEADDQIEDDVTLAEPTEESLREMGFGVAGGDK